MKQTFAVTFAHGPGWDATRPVRQQDCWDEHAAFIDSLFDDGFIRIAGPFPDDAGSLIIVEADSTDEMRQTFAADPWAPRGILLLDRVRRWQIFLDRHAG